MNQITDRIWIGDCSDARNLTAIKANGITAILNCAVDLQDVLGWNNNLTLAHCGLIDGEGNPLSSYYSAVYQLTALIDQSKTVLVHCHAGVSRSVSVVLMYLNATDHKGWEYWLAVVKSKRPIAAPLPAHKAAFDKMPLEWLISVPRGF